MSGNSDVQCIRRLRWSSRMKFLDWMKKESEDTWRRNEIVYNSHCTHCTDVIICWLSMFPSVMCLFFSCHWCHLAFGEWHQWHFFLLVITLGSVENQWIVILVQWVQCIFESREKIAWSFSTEVHCKCFIFRNDEFLEAKWWVGRIFYIILGCFFA